MAPALKAYNGNANSSTKMVALDFLFGEVEEIKAYQIVRFCEGEPWLLLDDGLLVSTLTKPNGIWTESGENNLNLDLLNQIGRFIDKQHFNFLPDKIKTHWTEAVQEVIMQNDSLYLVICKPGIDFSRFKNIFSACISHLVEDEWAVEFKVYNSEFSDEFSVEVF